MYIPSFTFQCPIVKPNRPQPIRCPSLEIYTPDRYLGNSGYTSRLAFQGKVDLSKRISLQENKKKLTSELSLQENLAIGEDVLAYFAKEYPNVSSFTRIQTDWQRTGSIETQHNLDQFRAAIFGAVGARAHRVLAYSGAWRKHRDLNREANNKSPRGTRPTRAMRLQIRKYVRDLPRLMREKGYGNCLEYAIVAEQYLRKQGYTDPKIFFLQFYTPPGREFPRAIPNTDHVIVVIGLRRDAKTYDEDSWGENAVIVDAWSGEVLPLKDGEKRYRSIFGPFPWGAFMEYDEFWTNYLSEAVTKK